MRNEIRVLYRTIGRRPNTSWRVSYAAVARARSNRRYTTCYKNGPTLVLAGSVGQAMTRFLLKCPSRSILFVVPPFLVLSLSGASLTSTLVYTERSAEKIWTVDDSPDPALYDSQPLRNPYKTHVAKGLASVQARSDSRPGSRCLHALHLFVGTSGRIFRIQHAQRLWPWIAVRGEWMNHAGRFWSRTTLEIELTLRTNH